MTSAGRQWGNIMNRQSERNDAGFSLVELCIVIAGAIILTVSAIPAYNIIVNSFRLALSGGMITTELQFARMKAVSSNEAFRVNFIPAQRVFQVETGAGAVVAGPFQLPDGIELNDQDGGPSITFGDNVVSFSPTGTVPSMGTGSAGRVKIRNQLGARVDVVVSTAGAVRQTPIYKAATAPF